ncbi:hypothetical protein JZ751_001663, partial [Albula glossodonta]
MLTRMSWNVHVLLLVVCLGYENGGCFEQGKPPNITELNPNTREQSLVVKWRGSDGYEESNLTFEIHVGRTEHFHIVQKTNVTRIPSPDDTLLSWKWASELPLQCIDHSIRIRRVFNDSFASGWSPWKTNFGEQEADDQTKMFPYQQVLKEGSSAYFCCIPRKGTNITSMIFSSTSPSMIDISDRVKAFVVENLNATPRFGVRFGCRDSKGDDHLCLNYVTFPPQRPQNLSCQTHDLRTVNCSWNPGRPSNLRKSYKRNYTMFIQNSNTPVSCRDHLSSCSFKAIPGQQVYRITVKVANNLGVVTESIIFNVTERVFPVPTQLEVKPGETHADLSWTVAGNLSGLGLLCQIGINPSDAVMDVQLQGQLDGWYGSRVQGLDPCKHYTATVRCSLAGKGWRWGPWADFSFYTIPCVELDIWGQVKQHIQGRNVTVMWRTHCNGRSPNVSIQEYKIQWEQVDQQGVVWVRGSREMEAELSIGFNASNISVTAICPCGPSVPSSITIHQAENREHLLKIRRVKGSVREGFQLSWAMFPFVTCGYVVEWCGCGTVPACNLQWKKVPKEFTLVHLPAGDFREGFRYTFSIYGCVPDGHKLLEVQTGYTEEQKPTKSPQLLDTLRTTPSSVILEWTFNEEDPTHTGFITGYLVNVQKKAQGSDPHSYHTSSYNLSMDDPCKKTLTVSDLHEDREYTFYVGARTVAGVGPLSSCTVRTPPNYSHVMVKVLIPILLVLGLGFLLWPHRRRVMGDVLEAVKDPVAKKIKALELDSSLYETSEKIKALKVEECSCCEIEVLEVRLMPELKLLLDSESCGSKHGDCWSQDLTFPKQDPENERMMNLNNPMYCLVKHTGSYTNLCETFIQEGHTEVSDNPNTGTPVCIATAPDTKGKITTAPNTKSNITIAPKTKWYINTTFNSRGNITTAPDTKEYITTAPDTKEYIATAPAIKGYIAT